MMVRDKQYHQKIGRKIKVLIIDDSALVRHTLKEILNANRDIEVIGTASDPYMAVQKIKEETPDVITLDLEMPRMDGLTFLSKLMAQHPVPVIIISTLAERNAENAILGLEYGAVEVIAKPKIGTRDHLKKASIELQDIVRSASKALVKRKNPIYGPKKSPFGMFGDKPIPALRTTNSVIAIGASTGGTEAIRYFLSEMPLDCPGIIITQHMPEMFTSQFAKRLNEQCRITVSEAKNGDSVLPGCALIAPGHSHMRLMRSGASYYVQVQDGPLVNRHKPSIDVLFSSVATQAGKNAVGVIMTGMGSDGAKGLLQMRSGGAYTIAQDEASCVVFGMPKEAIRLQATEAVLPLTSIPQHVLQKIVISQP